MAVNSWTIDALDNFTREELPATIRESLPELDPVYNEIQTTSLGVKRGDIGRDWEVMHLFGVGLAGIMHNADPRGPAMLDRAEYFQSLLLDPSSGALAPFPNALNAPHTSNLLRRLYLHRAVGNFCIPYTWLQGEALASNQIKQIVRDIREVGRNRALQEATSFYMNSDNCLCQIANWTTGRGRTTAAAAATFTVKAGTGRVQYFRVGQLVDILVNDTGVPQFGAATDGTNRRNYSTNYYGLIIADVDYLNEVITVASTANADISALSIANDDWVILRDNHTAGREMRTWGPNDWIKSSGQILGGSATIGNPLNPGLDLDSQSQFKSWVRSIGAPLTDNVMNAQVGKFLQAYTGTSLDTLISSMGVQLKYLEQPQTYNNRMLWDRTGKALDYQGGWDSVGYSFAGKRFKWIISNMCLSQHLYGMKFGGGNIQRYVPPRIGGVKPEVGSEVEFIASITGPSIFKPAHNGDGATMDVMEAPFTEYVLIAPVDVRSIKLTDITEANL